MNFENFQLLQEVTDAISDLGFTNPTEIQNKAIPILKGHDGDFVGQAQTGTGKTAAFIIPLLEQINPESRNIQALILTPTRELANQVHQEVVKLSKYLSINSTTVYGGVSYAGQISTLKKMRTQIVVGTPGRIIDLLGQRVLKLKNCHHLVIDEADEMLNMGFIDDVQTIIDSLNHQKKMWMFSATMPSPIVKLIEERFSRPKIARVEKKTLSNENIQQNYFITRKKHFADALQRFIDGTPECFGIIFCETRMETKELAETLISKGILATALHGELSQSERDHAMKRFKNRKVDLLICTDVAARGIDVANITHVFNMGLPRQNEAYIHRIGRTGRAGLSGKAISFVTPDSTHKLKQIETLTGQKIEELGLPGATELKKSKVLKELNKMDSIKMAIRGKEQDFSIDSSFKYFESYFQDLSKEQILKLLFTYRFNREIRQIDDSNHLVAPVKKKTVLKARRAKRNGRRHSRRKARTHKN